MPEILLVDDHSQVLAGMRRAAPQGRELWTLGWALDGAGALDYLSTHQVDVLVADIGMPGLDGATLLDEARVRFPDTARVVLSDGVNRDAIMSAAGAGQQFLPKSAEPAALIAALDSLLAARALVSDPHLRALLGGVDSLPRPPEIYAELVVLANSPNSTITQIAHLVERDLSVSAEVLKLVNSSFFAIPSEVSSVSRAISLLGLNVLQSLVLAGQAFRPSHRLPPDLDAAELAAAGLRASTVVRRTLPTAGWLEHAVSELAVAALLADVGLLTLAANAPAAWTSYRELVGAGRPVREAQLEAFGCTFGRAGGYVLGLWGFHPNVVNALAEQPLDLEDDAARAAASSAALAIAEARQVAAAESAFEGARR